MTSEPKEKFSDFWKAAQVDGWFTKMNLSEKLTYILAYKHYSLESGCDANLEFYRLIKEEAIPSLQQAAPKQESDALLKAAVQDAEDVLDDLKHSLEEVSNVLCAIKYSDSIVPEIKLIKGMQIHHALYVTDTAIEKINLWKSGKNR